MKAESRFFPYEASLSLFARKLAASFFRTWASRKPQPVVALRAVEAMRPLPARLPAMDTQNLASYMLVHS